MTAIQSMAYGSDGRLWVSGANDLGYFVPSLGSFGPFHSLKSLLPSNAKDVSLVWNVVLHDGKVYFATNSQVLRWDGSKFECWTYPATRRLWLMQSENRLYLSSTKVGLCEFKDGELTEIIPANLPGAFGPAWVEQQDDHLLVCCDGGLFRVKGGKVVPARNGARHLLESGRISSVTRLSKSAIAVSTLNSGVVVIDNEGDLIGHLGPLQGIPSVFINQVFLDDDGALWIVAPDNVVRFGFPTGLSILSELSGSRSDPVEGIVRSGSRLHLVTNGGSYWVTTNLDAVEELGAVPEVTENVTTDIELLDPDLLVSRFDGVFVRSADGFKRKIFGGEREISRLFRSLRHPSSVYLADIYRIRRFHRSGDGDYQLAESIECEADIRSVVEDNKGGRWIGALGRGVFHAPGSKSGLVHATSAIENGLPKVSSTSDVLAIGRNIVAITSAGSFLKGPDDDRFHPFPAIGSLRPLRVTRQNDQGDGWAALIREGQDFRNAQVLAHLRPAADGGVDVDWYDLPELDRIGTVRSLFADHDSAEPSLWVGGTDGVLRIELKKVPPSRTPRPPLLRLAAPRAEAPGTAAPPAFSFAENRATFLYSTTEFGRRPLLRYQTRLVGLESEWSAPSNVATREFPFLDDRAYRFEVRTVSASGLISPPVGFDFTVLPPWYRTGWAWFGYAAAAGLLFYAGGRVRTAAMRKRTEWLEVQVRERTAELEKANAAKTEFVARVNHDIRNPINGVLGLTLALEQTPLNPDQRRMTGTIKQCAKFLTTLVEEVLDFAEIELGNLRLRSEPFDPRETLAACIATVDPLAAAAGCKVTLTTADDLPARLAGDSARLQQILVNFLGNAVKFGAGAPVALSAAVLHRNAGRIVVRFAVRDRGPGLDEAEQQRLFVKFSRGTYAERQKIKGTGLGLAVCRLLAEKMGGQVGVVSRPGDGAEFFAELPFEIGAAPADAPPPALSGRARVLIVEDEEYNAVALSAMLRRMGFLVDRCADGLAALAQLGRERYDIVFLDWELPHLNGIDVARRFRATEPADRRTLIIATTAYASADKEQACRDAGMDEFVPKPLTPERLSAAIQGHGAIDRPATSILVQEDPPPADEEEVDLSLFSYLADESGSIAAKVAEFEATCERELAELGAVLAAGQAAELRSGAHRFLSQCRFVGARRMAGWALTLENTAYDPAGTEAREAYARLREEFAGFRQRLRASAAARAAGSGRSRSQSG